VLQYLHVQLFQITCFTLQGMDSLQKTFLTGMAALGITKFDIVEIYRSSGKSMQMRLDLFNIQVDITKKS